MITKDGGHGVLNVVMLNLNARSPEHHPGLHDALFDPGHVLEPHTEILGDIPKRDSILSSRRGAPA
jgi:hypothetical protein